MKLHKTFLVAALLVSAGNIYSMDWPLHPHEQTYVWHEERPPDPFFIVLTQQQFDLFHAVLDEDNQLTAQLFEQNKENQQRPLNGFENFLLNFGINWRQPDILASKPFQRFLILTAKNIKGDKKEAPHNIHSPLHEYLDVEECEDLAIQ